MKIPFDIKYRPQIESGEYKVETEAGFTAKVMDWEYNNKICGKGLAIKVIEGDGDHCLLYTYEGKRASIFPAEEGCDLFLVTPEPELSEFEEAVGAEIFDPPFNVEQVKVIKEESAKLLSIARKELCEQIVDHTKEAYENGKAEALKDLPRWRKWGNGACGNSDGHPIALVAGCGGIRFVNCLGTTGEKYIMLDDLKKLPGFNEDEK